MRAFRERFRNADAEIPKSLQSEPPDIIFTGLLEQAEMQAPALELSPPPNAGLLSEEALPGQMGDLLGAGMAPETGLAPDIAPEPSDIFADIPIEDVLDF